MKRIVSLLALSGGLLGAGCGDDPVSYSAPVGIHLKTRSGDVAGTAISEDKNITTETANPYGAFVSSATTKLGRAPGRIEVDQATLELGAQSTNVARLEDVFTGDVGVSFVILDSDTAYTVGTISNPTGVGPVELALTGADVTPQDFQKYLDGGFKVVAQGTAAAGFTAKGAEADLELTFTFAAFE